MSQTVKYASFADLTVQLNAFLIIVAIAIALWQWLLLPPPRSQFFKILGAIILLALPLEIYGGITNWLLINNNIVYNLFGQLEAMLVLYLISILRPSWKPVLLVSAMLFIVSFIINAIIRGTLEYLLLETVLLNALVLSILLMAALWWLAQNSSMPLHKVPEFWILLGLLIYFAGMVPTVGAYEFIFRDWEVGHKVFRIVQILCIIRYLFTAYACHLARKKIGWMTPAA